jgi:hypothetical protein
VSKTFQFCFTKSAIKCSPLLPRAAGENARHLVFLKTKAYVSKTKINFSDFFYIPKGKALRCTFILSVLFCSEIETRFTLCVRYTSCAGGSSLGAKSGFADEFPQKIFPITPPGNGNVGTVWVLEAFENPVLKSTKILRRQKKSPAKLRQKIKTAF